MQKILVSLPDQVAVRLRSIIPSRQRSHVISHLIEEEIERREHDLYACALQVEADEALNKEMKEWETTINDGVGPNGSW